MKKINVRPLGNRVIIEPLKVKKTTYGIVLPENVSEKVQHGVVVAIGEGTWLKEGHFREMSVSVGDIVVYNRFVGAELKIEDTTYLVLSEDDIFCVVEK